MGARGRMLLGGVLKGIAHLHGVCSLSFRGRFFCLVVVVRVMACFFYFVGPWPTFADTLLCAVFQLGFLHRDLKPGNILIDSEGAAVLADFETSKAISQAGSPTAADTVTSVLHVSFGYVANELLGFGGHAKYSTSTDMFAFGVVLAQVLIGKWGDGAAPPTAESVSACGPDVMSPKLRKLVLQLLSKDPAKRPPAQALLLLPFFRSAPQCFPAMKRRAFFVCWF